jgi:hypothetical protein
MEVLMEPENRPYIDSDTKPGDEGTEEWADTPPGSGDKARRGPLADPAGETDRDGAIDGSPADDFINNPGAIRARNAKGAKT